MNLNDDRRAIEGGNFVNQTVLSNLKCKSNGHYRPNCEHNILFLVFLTCNKKSA